MCNLRKKVCLGKYEEQKVSCKKRVVGQLKLESLGLVRSGRRCGQLEGRYVGSRLTRAQYRWTIVKMVRNDNEGSATEVYWMAGWASEMSSGLRKAGL